MHFQRKVAIGIVPLFYRHLSMSAKVIPSLPCKVLSPEGRLLQQRLEQNVPQAELELRQDEEERDGLFKIVRFPHISVCFPMCCIDY
jgi:hypothetical protein